MIEDLNLVGHSDTGLFQVLERLRDLPIFHVSFRIVIRADDEDAGMAASDSLDQQMEIAKILGFFVSRIQSCWTA